MSLKALAVVLLFCEALLFYHFFVPQHEEHHEAPSHGHAGVAHERTTLVRVISSRLTAAVEVAGVQVAAVKEEGDKGRGIFCVVLREDTLKVSLVQRFDTYLPGADKQLVSFLNGIHEGRIVALAVRDEGSFSLSEEVRTALMKMGSKHVGALAWRDTWAMLFRAHGPVLAEARGRSPSLNEWGAEMAISSEIALTSVTACPWADTEEHQLRHRFCAKYEGYGALCRCHHRLSLPRADTPDNRLTNVPTAVMATDKRPQYLMRTLLSLLTAQGANRANIVVFIDGDGREAQDVCRLLNITYIAHIAPSKKNGRIAQHYLISLTRLFALFSKADYAIVHEEDVDAAPDYFLYFAQTLPLLDLDPSLYCVSAWNDLGSRHAVGDARRLYRVETMPGLGWLLARKLFEGELRAKWPTPDKLWDWDMWMRQDEQRKGRECVIPDISRTFHFGASGVNMNPYFHETYFANRALNKELVLVQDIEDLVKHQYNALLDATIREAPSVNHNGDPCDASLFPKQSTATHLLFLELKHGSDWQPWLRLAKCWGLWDLDARGFHEGVWRLYRNGTPVIVIASTSPHYTAREGIVPFKMAATSTVKK
eukprot:m.104232 g.104232  ORF g.104232 m.104232 type:complete len:595 (+) comp14169_c0_seq1:151-1935(+)